MDIYTFQLPSTDLAHIHQLKMNESWVIEILKAFASYNMYKIFVKVLELHGINKNSALNEKSQK